MKTRLLWTLVLALAGESLVRHLAAAGRAASAAHLAPAEAEEWPSADRLAASM